MILRFERCDLCRQLFLLIWNFLFFVLRDMPFLEQLKVSYCKFFLQILFIVCKYRVRNLRDAYHVSCSSSPEKSQHRHIYRNPWSRALSCSLSTRLGKSVWVVSNINFVTTEPFTLFTFWRLMKTSSEQSKHGIRHFRAGLSKVRLY